MAQPERMAELMGGNLKQIRAAARAHRPQFGIIEMRVTAVHREVGMRQRAARSVEWITVAVFALLEADFNVNRARFLCRKRQVRVFAPHAERIEHLLVHFGTRQPFRVLGNAICKRLHFPAAALQCVPFGPRIGAEADLVLDATARQRHQFHGGIVQFAGDVEASEALEVADRFRPGAGVEETATGRIACGCGQIAETREVILHVGWKCYWFDINKCVKSYKFVCTAGKQNTLRSPARSRNNQTGAENIFRVEPHD